MFFEGGGRFDDAGPGLVRRYFGGCSWLFVSALREHGLDYFEVRGRSLLVAVWTITINLCNENLIKSVTDRIQLF